MLLSQDRRLKIGWKLSDIQMILSRWDEVLGPVVLDSFPSNFPNVTRIASESFLSTGAVFGQETFEVKQVKFTIPIVYANKGARVYYDAWIDSQVRGEKRIFSLLILAPEIDRDFERWIDPIAATWLRQVKRERSGQIDDFIKMILDAERQAELVGTGSFWRDVLGTDKSSIIGIIAPPDDITVALSSQLISQSLNDGMTSFLVNTRFSYNEILDALTELDTPGEIVRTALKETKLRILSFNDYHEVKEIPSMISGGPFDLSLLKYEAAKFREREKKSQFCWVLFELLSMAEEAEMQLLVSFIKDFVKYIRKKGDRGIFVLDKEAEKTLYRTVHTVSDFVLNVETDRSGETYFVISKSVKKRDLLRQQWVFEIQNREMKIFPRRERK